MGIAAGQMTNEARRWFVRLERTYLGDTCLCASRCGLTPTGADGAVALARRGSVVDVRLAVSSHLAGRFRMVGNIDPIRDAIEQRAFELFEQRGREHGNDWQDWFQAESEVLASFQADTVVQFGPSGLIDAAEWTLKRLAELGVNLPAGNRLQTAKTLIARVNNGQLVLNPDNDRSLYEVTEAQWTIMEHYVVARATNRASGRLSQEHRAKLEMMLSGAATTDVDANPLARNIQFELYIGATLAMGGARVTIEEPDLALEFLGERVGVAAKRVRSVSQLGRRVDDAVDQIKRSGRAGFVAVNVDVLVKNTGAPSAVIRLDERLEPLAAMDAKLRQAPEVLGSMVFGHDTCWNFGGRRPRVEVGHFVRFRLTAVGQAKGPGAYEFLARLLTRIKERQHKL